jgi:hypothetical protein
MTNGSVVRVGAIVGSEFSPAGAASITSDSSATATTGEANATPAAVAVTIASRMNLRLEVSITHLLVRCVSALR